jgi:hypothetical protein
LNPTPLERIKDVVLELNGLPFQIRMCAEATSRLVTVDVIEEREIELKSI